MQEQQKLTRTVPWQTEMYPFYWAISKAPWYHLGILRLFLSSKLIPFTFLQVFDSLKRQHFSEMNFGALSFSLLFRSLVSIAIYSFSSESESCSVVSNSLQPHWLYSPWNSPGQNTGVGGCPLLKGIFPTQGSNTGLQHCGRILYHLSHQGSPITPIGTE